MKKILIVCSHYLDDSDANAICVRNLVDEFDKNGINSLIITDEPQKNRFEYSQSIFYVKSSFYERITNYKKNYFESILFYVYSFIRRVLNLFLFPNVSPIRSLKVFKLAKKIIQKENIEQVLVTYRPFESIKTGLMIKKRMKNGIKVIAYHLDNLEDSTNKGKFISKFLESKVKRVFNKEKKLFDKILLTVTSRLYSSNSIKVGFPIIKDYSLNPVSLSFEKGYIHFSYIGTLDDYNRNPKEVFSFFEKFHKLVPLQIHIWGKISESIADYIKDNVKFLKYHGFIEQKYTEYIYKKSDYLLNFGNMVTKTMLPSKVFRLFATKKPIISFNYFDDSSIQYLKEYKATLLISYDMLKDPNTELAMLDFINIKKFDFETSHLNEPFKVDYVVKKIIC